MKVLKTLGIVALALLAGTDASAIRAKRGVRTVTQPDGTELRIKVVGDEFMHMTFTEDGRLLHCDADGLYTYATVDTDGAVVSTGVAVTEAGSAEGVRFENIDFDAVERQRVGKSRRSRSTASYNVIPVRKSRMQAPQSGMGLYDDSYPVKGTPKGLIILVEYSDVKFTLSNPKSYFTDLINGDNFTQYGGTGSALRYFKDQSNGQFAPSFDVYGPVTLPQNRKYYGGNDRYGDDMHPEQMVTDAIKILDSTVNFKQYDTNGDGLIDNVYVFYAGEGEADSYKAETVWPHSWDVRSGGQFLTVDGVMVGRYACSNEWSVTKRPDGIGTFVHEFSHVMGLPDLYHTADAVYYTPCEYSVMDYGPYNNDGCTPPNYSAYERNAMGWFEPIMMTEPMTVSLEPISSGQFGLIPTSKNTEFFLFENRQLTGWDKYIPYHGMLIWHIDYVKSVFEENVVNNTKSHQYVDIVEANNNPDGTSLAAMKGWPFPGTGYVTEFTPSTKPALKDWNGNAIDLPVTDIDETDGIITFDVAGGSSSLTAPAPSATPSVEGSRHFVASWDAVEGAVDYLVSVYAVGTGQSGSVSTGFNGSQVGAGWKASSTDWYTTNSNYGQSAPSFKFSKDGQTLTSPEVDGDITRLEFWSKGQSNKSTYLLIEAMVEGKWLTVDQYYPTANQTETVVYESEIPSGARQIRFTMSKSAGNIAVDDIVIDYGAANSLVKGYDQVSTGGLTSIKVDNLPETSDLYYFTVCSTDGKKKSKPSEPVYVNMKDTTGVGEVAVDADDEAEYYNLQGMRVYNPTSGTMVICRRGQNVTKVVIP